MNDSPRERLLMMLFPTALVLGDCKVLWPDGVHHSPDVAVYLGVREVQDYYSQFDVAAEGVRPRLIIEIVSPNTRENDVVAGFAGNRDGHLAMAHEIEAIPLVAQPEDRLIRLDFFHPHRGKQGLLFRFIEQAE